MQKIISFIIPAYNVEIYLKKALDSMLHKKCLDQTEILIINDGSSDSTINIAQQYAKEYPDTVYLINKKNGGHGSAINIGTSKAKGKYFKVIDADDWIVKENLPSFIKILSSCFADVVLTPFHQVDMANGEKQDWRMYCQMYEKTYNMSDVIRDWKSFFRCLTFHGITYKTEFYNRYRHELPEGIFYEDHEFATIPCCHAKNIFPVDLYIYQYLVGNVRQSVSDENRVKRISHMEQVTKDLLNYGKYHKDITADAREFLYLKTEAVILSYYMIACVIKKDKSQGRLLSKQYNNMIYNLDAKMFERVKRKYFFFILMNRLYVPQMLYLLIIRSRIYSSIRKLHRIEKV